MDVYFNELSHRPFGSTKEDGRKRVLDLLGTMKDLRSHQFGLLRTHSSFYSVQVSENYSFLDFLEDDDVSRVQKTLLTTIARHPFIPNDDSPEAEMFLMYGFETLDHEGKFVSPEGLAAAYVHDRPTLSISSHAFWQKSPLVLNVTADLSFASQEEVMNFWSTDSVEAWKSSLPAEKVVEIPLDSKENIKARFPESTYHFEERAMNDMIFWFANDERYQRRIVMLIRDISTNPFTGGIGKTETLGGQGGMASKRIGEKDRLVYTYTEEKITIHSCRGHYDDH
jgi:toxin YoeB